jgi:hypothetical protein
MKHCGECGSSINSSAKYCNNCGTKIVKISEFKKISNKKTNTTPVITIIFLLLSAYEFLYLFAEESGLAFVLMIAFAANAFLPYKVESQS